MRTVFIANRGEIAVRIARSVRARGLRPVGIYSDADAGALHPRCLDEAIRLAGRAPAETYLDSEKVLDAAVRLGADALHPGYGFLSENADFAEACATRGIVFLGPPPGAIRLMGDKGAAKRLMAESAVPLVPGYSGTDQDNATLAAEAKRIGFPVLLKASAGGGGRGMRRVASTAELEEAIAQARSEATSAFGRGDLIIEKLVEGARHVEVQVVADTQGTVAHLFERECSVQRRHQKVIEEAPSPAVDAALREKLGLAATRAAAAVGYVGVGTVEFLLASSGEFYFIEMNTRLQVEHPVTERVTGVDLVDLQLAIGEGLPLPELPRQPRGWAIEARIYAEDPANGYAPQTGVVHDVCWPTGIGIRVDDGVSASQEVTPHYDSMLGKVVADGPSREHARRRLTRALEQTSVFGVTTNIAFLCDVLEDHTFVTGEARVDWLDARSYTSELAPVVKALAALRFLVGTSTLHSLGTLGRSAALLVNGELVQVRIYAQDGQWAVSVGEYSAAIGRLDEDAIELDGCRYRFGFISRSSAAFATYRGHQLEIRLADTARAADEASTGEVRAPMNGRLVTVKVVEGDRVKRGDLLATLEAMKMEHELTAPIEGVVRVVSAAEGAQAEARQVLFEVKEAQ
ncbi:MAG: biotin carboxylase N-terminal domain-containing protein [Myxococcota bacterium]